jgi:WhiB family transcriptional regulator, redox-sensing transcriptional regulator
MVYMDQDTAREPLSHSMEYTRWQEFGVCTSIYTEALKRGDDLRPLDDIFFGALGRPRAEADSTKLCKECPVQRLCYEDAIVHGEMFGVWGGLTVEQREHVIRYEWTYVSNLIEMAIRENWLQKSRISRKKYRKRIAEVEARIAREKKLEQESQKPAVVLTLQDFQTFPEFDVRTEAS